MQVRDPKGRILEGSQLPEGHRQAISRGQIARHLRQRMEVKDAHVDRKKCTKCHQWKDVPADYVMKKRQLKSGEIRRYASGECKQCGRERAEKWKQDYIAKYGEKAWKDKQEEYKRNRNQEKRKQYQREYGRIRRIEQGVTPRGPWKKYRNESGGRAEKIQMSSTPVRIWWDNLDKETKAYLNLDESLSRRIKYARTEPNIEIKLIDRIVDALKDPNLYQVLAPGVNI